MWRLINFVLVLLCLFGRPRFLRAQEIQLEKPNTNEQPSCNDRTTPAFWENLSHLPVQFTNRHKESGILVGQFISSEVFDFTRIEFKLTPENKKEEGLFFQVDGDWEEEISRKAFLKKFKNDLWVVSYLTVGKENVICEAHQVKNWQSLVVSYAQGSKNFNIKTPAFWNNLKAVPVYFNEVKEDNAFWLFIQELGNASVPEYAEPIRLQNGKLVNKYQKFSNGALGIVLDHDFFTIDKNCVFHVMEKKDPRLIQIPKIKMTQFALNGRKIRVRPVDRDYFNKNALQKPWLCFYEKDFENRALVLLRAVGVSSNENNGKKNGNNKKGGNNKNHNGSRTK